MSYVICDVSCVTYHKGLELVGGGSFINGATPSSFNSPHLPSGFPQLLSNCPTKSDKYIFLTESFFYPSVKLNTVFFQNKGWKASLGCSAIYWPISVKTIFGHLPVFLPNLPYSHTHHQSCTIWILSGLHSFLDAPSSLPSVPSVLWPMASICPGLAACLGWDTSVPVI